MKLILTHAELRQLLAGFYVRKNAEGVPLAIGLEGEGGEHWEKIIAAV